MRARKSTIGKNSIPNLTTGSQSYYESVAPLPTGGVSVSGQRRCPHKRTVLMRVNMVFPSSSIHWSQLAWPSGPPCRISAPRSIRIASPTSDRSFHPVSLCATSRSLRNTSRGLHPSSKFSILEEASECLDNPRLSPGSCKFSAAIAYKDRGSLDVLVTQS